MTCKINFIIYILKYEVAIVKPLKNTNSDLPVKSQVAVKLSFNDEKPK